MLAEGDGPYLCVYMSVAKNSGRGEMALTRANVLAEGRWPLPAHSLGHRYSSVIGNA